MKQARKFWIVWTKHGRSKAALYPYDEVRGAPRKPSEQSGILIVSVVRKLRYEDGLD